MQVLQWLFKVAAHEQKQADISKARDPSKEVKSYKRKRDLRKPEETSLDCKSLRYIGLLLKRSNSKTYFSKTLQQKRISNLNPRLTKQQRQYILSMKMKEELIRGLGKNIHKVATDNNNSNNVHVGNKVLPISDSTNSSTTKEMVISSNADVKEHSRDSDLKKDRSNKGDGNKNKTISRMKELLRWAAAAKSEKGGKFGKKVLHFRNKSATVKSGGFDEEITNESPKISIAWEVESCSTTCSAASAPPSIKYDECARKTGSWITTDDEFVVLEL